jgi:T5SS/PEP-CTERM-associated repeat protein
MDVSFRGLFFCALWLTVPARLFATVTLSGDATNPSGNIYNVGNTSTGSMSVDGGSTISGGTIKLALAAGSQGALTISGVGTSVATSGGFSVGTGAPPFATNLNTDGTVNIINGGKLTTNGSNTTGSYIGNNLGTTGTVNVTGAGSTYDAIKSLYIGNYGTGTINVTAGARLTYANMGPSAGMHIGSNTGGTGTLLVDGVGSTFSGMGATVGSSGTGNIIVRNGAGYSGLGVMSIGSFGTGNITVSGGASFTQTVTSISSAITLGIQGTGKGTITVDGAGSTMTTRGNLIVGAIGTGSMTISNGASAKGYFNEAVSGVYNQGFLSVANDANSSGTVNVTGADSTWTTVGNIYLGLRGAGALNITSGGVANNAISNASGQDFQNIYIGSLAGSSGRVLIDGAGSQWNVTGNSTIMSGGTEAGSSATITVRSGGQANLTSLYAYNKNTITVTGANSVMNVGQLVLGNNLGFTDLSTIAISDGGTVNSGNTYIGNSGVQGVTVSTSSVDGSNTKWNVTGVMKAGSSSVEGDITLRRGGTLSIYSDASHKTAGLADGTLLLGDMPSSSNDGTPPSTGVLYIGTGEGAGILNASSVSGYVANQRNSKSTIIFNHNQSDYFFTNTGASGGTGVTIAGSTGITTVAGTTILTANSTNQGTTKINGGTLIVDNTGGAGTSGTGRGSIIVGTDGTLGGTGLITPSNIIAPNNDTSAQVTQSSDIRVSGTLSAGSVSNSGASTIGTLTIDSGSSSAAHILTLESDARLQFDLGAGLSSDRIVLLNGSTADIFFYGNIINFNDLTDGQLDAGSYTLFTASALANYGGLITDSNNLITSGLSLGTGLENYDATLAVSGGDIVLKIASVPEPSTWLLVILGGSGFWLSCRRQISRRV